MVAAAAEDLLALFYGHLSDEAAAHIAEFLSMLSLRFDETHASTIRRYYESQIPCRDVDPRQLDLFHNDMPF